MTHASVFARAKDAVLALAVVALLLAVSGCEVSTGGSLIAPATVPGAAVIVSIGSTFANPATYCAAVGVITPALRLVVTSGRSNVSVDEVTLHLLDGTNLGGPGVTFPRADLTAQFADTIVRTGTSRTFVLAPTFRCGVSAPRSIRGDVHIIDATGARTVVTAALTWP